MELSSKRLQEMKKIHNGFGLKGGPRIQAPDGEEKMKERWIRACFYLANTMAIQSKVRAKVAHLRAWFP